ncbi:tail fiber domain-containing protein [Burkholderia multivorans]|nr:tail fiber domain-containing protein [Burkholderia multivorans]
MALKLSNNAVGYLAAALPSDSTAIALRPGEGASFPNLSAGDWCPGTLIASTGEIEVVRVTARAGDSFTVERAQEGTAARQFKPGDRFEHRLTAAALMSIVADVLARLPITGGTITGDLSIDGTLAAGSVDAATLKRAGKAVWDAGNFTPGDYARRDGADFVGLVRTAQTNSPMAQNDTTCSLDVRNSGGSGDAALAALMFECVGSYATKLGLRADGYFGLGGGSSQAWRWYSAANGDMVAAGNVGAYSDPRLKDDIEPILGALEIIRRLTGVRFTWNDRTQLVGKIGARDIGVLADEVEAVLPEVVGRSMPDEGNGGERWRTVAYDKLVPVLIEAVKELAARLDLLEA